jgi:membrane protease YdiL (CAAX protease family)
MNQKVDITDSQRSTIKKALVLFIVADIFFSRYVFSFFELSPSIFLGYHVVANYALLAFSILYFGPDEFENLGDVLSITFIVLGCFLPIIFHSENPLLLNMALFAMGVMIAIYLYFNWHRYKKTPLKAAIGVTLWSFFFVLFVSIVYSFIDKNYARPIPDNLPFQLFMAAIYQFSYVAVIEEGIFRGLLYGIALKSFGKNKAILLQAALFWLSHIFETSNPVYFYLLLPLGTIFLTFLINRYKMLWTSIVAHVFLNIFFATLVTLINMYLH